MFLRTNFKTNPKQFGVETIDFAKFTISDAKLQNIGRAKEEGEQNNHSCHRKI